MIFGVHMPLFFFISGYLYKNSGINISKWARAYLFPAIVLCLLEILIRLPLIIPKHYSVGTWIKTLTIMGGFLVNQPLWFLPSLFCCIVIFSLLIKLERRMSLLVLITGIVFFSIFKCPTELYLWPINAFAALPFFVLGNAFKRIRRYFESRIYAAISFLAYVLLVSYNGMFSIAHMEFGRLYVIGFFGAFCGIICIWNFGLLLCKSKLISNFFSIIGSHSFDILVTHFYLCRILIPKVFDRLESVIPTISQLQNSFFVQCLLTVIIVVGYYYFFTIFKKFSIQRALCKKR